MDEVKLRVKIIKDQAELINVDNIGEQDKLNTIMILCDEILKEIKDENE